MTQEQKEQLEHYRLWAKERKNIEQMVKNNPKMKAKPTEKDWEEMRKIKSP